jgi:putative copper resistance protein D
MATRDRLTTAQRSPWRWPAAALAVVVAAAHIPVTAEHLSEAPYIGWSFVALEIAAVLLAVMLVAHDARVTWATARIVPALAIAAYVVTRSVSLPQISDDVGNWTEPLGVVALSAEALLVVVAVGHPTRGWRKARLVGHPVGLASGVLALGAVAVGYAAARGPAMADVGEGHAMRPMVSGLPPLQWSSFAGHWQVRPWWLLFSVLALAAYLGAVTVAARHGVRAVHPARVASFVAGIALLLFTVSSAIDTYAMAIFWDHMIEHLLLIMAVPALLICGHPFTAVRAAASTRGGEAAFDGFARSWPVSLLTHPLVSFGLYAAVIIVTHLTGFMDAMATHAWLMDAEQWLYLTAGCLYLVTLLGDEPIRWQLPFLGRLALILLGMAPDTVVGIVLMQTSYDMFPAMEGAHPAWAPASVDDLHIAGGLMWAGGDGLMMLFGVAVGIAMITHPGSKLLVGARLESIRRRTLAQQIAMGGGALAIADDDDVDEDDAVLAAYNQMLGRMNDPPAAPPSS